ncbi:MAG: trypsin-like peptidase domain-containing protein [Hyphomicrobiaceae bacterium]
MTVQAEIQIGKRRVVDLVLPPFLKYRDENLRERYMGKLQIHFTLITVTVVSAMGVLSTSVAKVVGKDTRQLVPASYRDIAKGIGLLQDTTNRSYCTAFCVAPDTIMTNAHCVAWPLKKLGGRKRDVRDFVFRFVSNGRGYAKENLAWNHVVPVGDPKMSLLHGSNVKGVMKRKGNDWAIAKLYSPICGTAVLSLASSSWLKKQRRKLKVATIGFHQDLDRKKTYSWGEYQLRFSRCKLTRPKRGIAAEHTCDTSPRSSGSPIFVSTPSGQRVVAIHQGWRGYYRWRRTKSGKKKITKRWTKNYAVLTPRLAARVSRFADVSLISRDSELSYARFVAALEQKNALVHKSKSPSWPAVSRAIERYERRRGWYPLGIPSKELLDDLLKK